MARQGRRLRHPGLRRRPYPFPLGQLLQRGRPAAVRDRAIAAGRGLARLVSLRVLAASSPGEIRVAVTRDDRLLEYAIWRPGAPDGVGDLHRGRIAARAPAMAGAFVTLDGADGFLPDTEGAADATEGMILA